MKRLLSLCVLATIVSACVPNISSDQIQAGNANEATSTDVGKIVSAKEIAVGANSDNKTGMLAGAATGAIAGSAIGGGRGELLTGLAGGLIGGIAGNAIQGKMSSQNGMQYVLRKPDGVFVTVVQGIDPIYSVGQCVFLIKGEKARIALGMEGK